MNKEEILIAIKEILCRYSIPALEQNYTDKDYACKQFEKLVIHLANQQEEKDKEIERLNNIINDVNEFVEWHYKDNQEFYKNKGIGLNYPECDYVLKKLKENNIKGELIQDIHGDNVFVDYE